MAGNNLVNADFFPYFRMFFAVKCFCLTLYIAHMCHIEPIYSAPLYLLAPLAVAVVPPARSLPAARLRARGLARSARLLSCLPAPVPACSHACLRTCARARMRGLLAPVVRAYIVASPAVLLLAVLLSPPAANFFEIVCGLSISIQPSSAWADGTILYCYTG